MSARPINELPEGPYAFPFTMPLPNGSINFCPGMTLRDYFAAKALAAMIGNESKDFSNRGSSGVPKLAQYAYEYADAMLAERDK